jgi:hypothetical protein
MGGGWTRRGCAGALDVDATDVGGVREGEEGRIPAKEVVSEEVAGVHSTKDACVVEGEEMTQIAGVPLAAAAPTPPSTEDSDAAPTLLLPPNSELPIELMSCRSLLPSAATMPVGTGMAVEEAEEEEEGLPNTLLAVPVPLVLLPESVFCIAVPACPPGAATAAVDTLLALVPEEVGVEEESFRLISSVTSVAVVLDVQARGRR